MEQIKPMTKFVKKELAARWQVSVRTVERDVKKYGLTPADYVGKQPVWELADVERMEQRRRAAKLAQGGYLPEEKIISVKEARRQARKGGRR